MPFPFARTGRHYQHNLEKLRRVVRRHLYSLIRLVSGRLDFRLALVLVRFEMGAQARYDFFFLAFVDLFLHFFEREVDDVVMVQLCARQTLR